MSKQQSTGADLVNKSIIEKYPAQMPFVASGALLGITPAACYVLRSRGCYPVRVRQQGGRLIVFTSDQIDYLNTGISQAELSVKPIRKCRKIKTGRPTKREELEAKAKGLSVKELRAQSTLAGA